jgi:rod shape-determining protein MreC
MRNLIYFIAKNNAFFLFILLEIICLFLIFQNNPYQGAAFFNSTNAATGNVYRIANNVTDYFNLRRENDALQTENIWLRSQLNSAKSIDTVNIYAPADTAQLYTFIPAKVIKNTSHRLKNYITLNRGRKHGIEKEMGVISSNGVVGVVVKVTENLSLAMSLLHNDFAVGARVTKHGYPGRVKWNGSNSELAQLLDVSSSVNIRVGDTVFTTESSGIFPQGINIGTIGSFEKVEGSNFYEIDVKLATRFYTLSYVYIVNSLQKKERDKLEVGIEENK